jgi:D-alanyl-lipoteichoic acid acyltransferase DltB (MBOAT superfamily)
MLFNTFPFLGFFVVVAAGYFLLRGRARLWWLLGASYYFYMSWEPWLGILLLASTVVDYACGIGIGESEDPRVRRRLLWTSLGLNLGILFVFKYLGFFSESLFRLLRSLGFAGPDPAPLEGALGGVILPIGLSFYTFQTLSYTIEVYRGRFEPERDFSRYALFVAFFPQLVAGPIERATRFLPQLDREITFDLERVRMGLAIMAWGFFLKVVGADRLGVYVDTVYLDPAAHAGWPQIAAMYFFAFQIYFDFAGYSIIALGAAKVFGFDLMVNFDRPFWASNVGAFWRRWHISLMSWLRDYLFRVMVRRRVEPLTAILLVFAISGLWHGANWTFLVWGTLNGVVLVLERQTGAWRARIRKRYLSFIPERLATFTMGFLGMTLLSFLLILFRSPSMSAALGYMAQMPRLGVLSLDVLGDRVELALCFGVIAFAQLAHWFRPEHRVPELVLDRPVALRWTAYLGYALVIVLLGIARKEPFIYFQF